MKDCLQPLQNQQKMNKMSALIVLESRERFKDVLINIGEDEEEVTNTEVNSDVVCSYHPGRPDDVHRFNCTTRMYGRYVRVIVLHKIILNLYEIEVIGFK